jgi:hypothetical protein
LRELHHPKEEILIADFFEAPYEALPNQMLPLIIF